MRGAIDVPPIVDIGPFVAPGSFTDNERECCALQFDAAMRSAGIATIVGHNVNAELIANLEQSARDFFGLDHKTKMKSWAGAFFRERGGFSSMRQEKVSNQGSGESSSEDKWVDPLESFSYLLRGGQPSEDQIFPTEPVILNELAQRYISEANRLCCILWRISAYILGLPADYFEETLPQSGKCFRMSHYPADKTGQLEGQPRKPAHTDLLGYTILRPDPQVHGLEAQFKPGEWTPIVPPAAPGLVVLAGDLVERWTCARWRACMHRVVHPTDHKELRARLSLIMFTGPDDDEVTIDALPTCRDATYSHPEMGITVRDKLMQAMKSTRSKIDEGARGAQVSRSSPVSPDLSSSSQRAQGISSSA